MFENQFNIKPKEFSVGRSQVLKYLTRRTVFLNLPFILTHNKLLTIGKIYMKTENWLADSKTETVKLLDVYDCDNIVNLKVQSLNTLQIQTLWYNLNYKDNYWLWCIMDLNKVLV